MAFKFFFVRDLSVHSQDIVFTGDEEDMALPDPAERFEELLTRCVCVSVSECS